LLAVDLVDLETLAQTPVVQMVAVVLEQVVLFITLQAQ
jgi:hypothetical protein